MNRQSQWLFEAPPAQATHPNNLSASSEFYSPELNSDPFVARRRVPLPPFFPPRSKRNPLGSRFSRARAFIAKRATARMPVREIAQEYEEQPRRYFYWDVWWLNPSSGKYEALETQGPLYTIRDDGEKIRSTLLLKWQVRRGSVLARCFVWNGEKWFLCKDYSF